MTDRVRVLRVLEYEGPRDWVESCIANRSVKGIRRIGVASIIRESVIGETPVVLQGVRPGNISMSTAEGREAERKAAAELRNNAARRIYHWSGCPCFHNLNGRSNPDDCTCDD